MRVSESPSRYVQLYLSQTWTQSCYPKRMAVGASGVEMFYRKPRCCARILAHRHSASLRHATWRNLANREQRKHRGSILLPRHRYLPQDELWNSPPGALYRTNTVIPRNDSWNDWGRGQRRCLLNAAALCPCNTVPPLLPGALAWRRPCRQNRFRSHRMSRPWPRYAQYGDRAVQAGGAAPHLQCVLLGETQELVNAGAMASPRSYSGGGAFVVCLLLLRCECSAVELSADASLRLSVPAESAAGASAGRPRRAAGSALDCAESPEMCDIYSRVFQSLPGTRTAGEPTLRGVSRETCAAQCALRAPACRHFSYQPQQRLCVLGCRPGSATCQRSGELVQDAAWTFHFLSARRLASVTNSVVVALQSRAAAAGVELRNITGALEGGRFGGQQLSVGAEPAIEKLFGSPGPRPAGGAAADMIANGRSRLLPTDCGRVPLSASAPPPVPSILGGEAAYPGQYPWQARILVREGHSYVHRCGGTIISDRHILSAAHCLRDVSIGRIEVRVGETDFDDLGLFSNSRQIFTLVNMRFHDSYLSDLAGGTFSNDIMMLQLRPQNGKLIKFDELVQPACLPRSGLEYQGLRPAQTFEAPLSCNVSGWGKTSREATVTSPVLRGVEVPLVSDSYCGSPEAYGRRFQSDIMFCAGFTDEGVNRDSCGGDSGGPLACPLLDSGLFAVYGVVSHSHPKGCGREPGMYTKVSHFTDWVLNAVENLA